MTASAIDETGQLLWPPSYCQNLDFIVWPLALPSLCHRIHDQNLRKEILWGRGGISGGGLSCWLKTGTDATQSPKRNMWNREHASKPIAPPLLMQMTPNSCLDSSKYCKRCHTCSPVHLIYSAYCGARCVELWVSPILSSGSYGCHIRSLFWSGTQGGKKNSAAGNISRTLVLYSWTHQFSLLQLWPKMNITGM